MEQRIKQVLRNTINAVYVDLEEAIGVLNPESLGGAIIDYVETYGVDVEAILEFEKFDYDMMKELAIEVAREYC